jgi:hypothetical protein
MKTNKNKEKKSFFCLEEIISKYFPSEMKEKRNIAADNPRLLGEHFAAQALKQINLS